jgi:hypothetical protein
MEGGVYGAYTAEQMVNLLRRIEVAVAKGKATARASLT